VGLSLRTNGEAVGTGVLCGSTATFGFILLSLPAHQLQGDWDDDRREHREK